MAEPMTFQFELGALTTVLQPLANLKLKINFDWMVALLYL